MISNTNSQSSKQNNICKICGHDKKEHRGHIAPDWTGRKVNHISCYFTVKRDDVSGFMSNLGVTSVGHACSCDGFKPNTSLKRAIKKYKKFLKELPQTSDNLYRRKEVMDAIKRFRKSIRDNPKNLLYWQKESEVIV